MNVITRIPVRMNVEYSEMMKSTCLYSEKCMTCKNKNICERSLQFKCFILSFKNETPRLNLFTEEVMSYKVLNFKRMVQVLLAINS